MNSEENDIRTKTNRAARTFWVITGLVFLGFGIAGAVLPLLPTTPFLLLAVFAFSRSSQRLHHWLIQHPHFGKLIRDWQNHGAIDRRTKYAALLVIVLTPLISWSIGVPAWILGVQIIVLLIATVFIFTRPDA